MQRTVHARVLAFSHGGRRREGTTLGGDNLPPTRSKGVSGGTRELGESGHGLGREKTDRQTEKGTTVVKRVLRGAFAGCACTAPCVLSGVCPSWRARACWV